MFKKFFAKQSVKNKPLDKIIEKTSIFLRPQINTMEQFDGNKFGFITFESIFYMMAVAEEIGKRQLMQDEYDKFFSSILGDEYRKRINHLFDFLKSRDAAEFTDIIIKIKEIARSDVEKGIFFCSNFLVENAKFLSLEQKRIANIQ